MKYALLINDDDSGWVDLPADEQLRLRREEMPRWQALFEEIARVDPDSGGFELRPRGEAKVVRVRDGQTFVSDGPFAETKEALGGLMLLELPDLDEAIRLAALIPAAADTGSIEIRPVMT